MSTDSTNKDPSRNEPLSETSQANTENEQKPSATDITERVIDAVDAEVNTSEEEGGKEVAKDLEAPIFCFRIGIVWFAIPATSALEVWEKDNTFSLPKAPEHIPGIINLRGRIIPLLDLERFLHLATSEELEEQEYFEALTERVVVVSAAGMRVGIICDQVSGVLEITKESWKEKRVDAGEKSASISDGLIEGPMGLVTLLNIERLLDAARVRK